MLASPLDERELTVEVVDPIGLEAVAAKHLGSWLVQRRTESPAEAKNPVFSECEYESLAQQVRPDTAPFGFDQGPGAANVQRCGKQLQTLAPVASEHQVPVAPISLDKQMFNGGGIAMIAVDEGIGVDECAFKGGRVACHAETAASDSGKVQHKSSGGIQVVKAQSFVHRSHVPAGRQVSEDESFLPQKSADEPQAVRPVLLEYTERREVADVDSGPIDVALRIDGNVRPDDGAILGDELEAVIGADVIPRRHNELLPCRGGHAIVEVLVQKFADHGSIVRGNRFCRDAGIGHTVSLRGV